MLPLNSTGSCGMMATELRSVVNPTVCVSTSSMTTRPAAGSTRRRIHNNSDDLPLPVRPHTPTFSPPLTENDTFFSTRGRSGRYRMSKSLNASLPSDGQRVSSSLSAGSSAGGSVGSSLSSTKRSTAFILEATSAKNWTQYSRVGKMAVAFVNATPARAMSMSSRVSTMSRAVRAIRVPDMTCKGRAQREAHTLQQRLHRNERPPRTWTRTRSHIMQAIT